MPPPASRWLSLWLIPEQIASYDPQTVLSAWAQAGLGLENLVVGGLTQIEAGQGKERFFSWGQGGFRVFCPQNGAALATDFGRAMGQWRAGGPRQLACGCGQMHDLHALHFQPPAGFAQTWIGLRGAVESEVSPIALEIVRAYWGDVRVLPHRGA